MDFVGENDGLCHFMPFSPQHGVIIHHFQQNLTCQTRICPNLFPMMYIQNNVIVRTLFLHQLLHLNHHHIIIIFF